MAGSTSHEYRGFAVGLAGNLAHPRGWYGVATVTGGDLAEDEHEIRTSKPFDDATDAFAAAETLARDWIDSRSTARRSPLAFKTLRVLSVC